EDELRDALPPKFQQLWTDIKPRGLIHLNQADVFYRSGDPYPRLLVTISPVADTVSIKPSFFPYRLEKLKGRLTFQDGRSEFRDLQGVHNQTLVSASGYCEHKADQPWHVRFDKVAVDRM